MSAYGGKADVPATWPGSPLLAEAVEEVTRVGNFETMIQKPRRCWINVASGSAYENDSYTKSVGSDFFDSLSQEETFERAKASGNYWGPEANDSPMLGATRLVGQQLSRLPFPLPYRRHL